MKNTVGDNLNRHAGFVGSNSYDTFQRNYGLSMNPLPLQYAINAAKQ